MINVIIIILLFLSCAPQEDKYFKTREEMVNDQIESRGISNQPTLDAMKKVSRHKFVPPNLLDRAYDDGPLPIGYGQTISQPYIVAYMTAVIDPKPDNIVLEIGTGSGYQAAVLAEIIDSVFTIEIVQALAGSAEQRLKPLGFVGINVR